MNKKIKCIDLVSYAIIKPKYGGFFFFILAFITSCVCYQYIGKTFEWKERDEKARRCVLAFFIVFSQYCWQWSFMCGNHGSLACCFIVIAVCIYKEHPPSGFTSNLMIM